ncbi:MAG: CopD family protein [Balneolales bacterium]
MYTWAVFFHVLIAIFWIGGMLFTVAVLVPATRQRLASQKGLLFSELGTRFSQLSWALFPLLVFTGVLALLGKGYRIPHLIAADFWKSGYGMILGKKIAFFAVVLIISGLHDFWLGPKAARLMDSEPGQPRTRRFRSASRWAGRFNLMLALTILFLAVSLIR